MNEMSSRAAPASVGLDANRLTRLDRAIEAGIEAGEIPGAVVLVARDGRVAHHRAFGYRDREAGAAMGTDAIFRIASMTKPITSLAVMMLAEEGLIQIGYPVSRWIPELGNLRVAVEEGYSGDPANVPTVPAKSEITVQDLLRHSSGLTYGFMGADPVHKLYDAVNPNDPANTNAEMVAKLSTLPLRFHPGTAWEYSVATDVLGRLVEVVSGQPLDQFLSERILGPLGMVDTGFVVDGAAHHRIAEAQVDPATGKRPPQWDVRNKPNRLGGGGSLVSTSSDYLRFCRMMLNGGELDGTRYVSRKTVEWMTADHLHPGIKATRAAKERIKSMSPGADTGQGFGLGFGMRLLPGMSVLPGSVGDFFWAGSQGTCFWIDPKERLIAIFMMQAPEPREHYRHLMRELVYQSIVD